MVRIPENMKSKSRVTGFGLRAPNPHRAYPRFSEPLRSHDFRHLISGTLLDTSFRTRNCLGSRLCGDSQTTRASRMCLLNHSVFQSRNDVFRLITLIKINRRCNDDAQRNPPHPPSEQILIPILIVAAHSYLITWHYVASPCQRRGLRISAGNLTDLTFT